MSHVPMSQRVLLCKGTGSAPYATMTAVVRRGYATWLSPARMSVRITEAGREYLRTLGL